MSLRRLLTCALFAPSLFGIVINDANDPAYITGSTNFTGVALITFNIDQSQFVCSGSLMSTGIHILTAGHCVSGASNWNVTFQTGSGNTQIAVVDADLHPLYSPRPPGFETLSQYDVAILTLSNVAPADAQRYGLKLDYSGVTTATSLDIVGYGRGNQLLSGTRRHAVNTIDSLIGGPEFPDLPFLMSLTYGAGAANEGLVAPGDSGGPALLGNSVLGVASFVIDYPQDNTFVNGNLYRSGHASLADAATGSWVADFLAIPEPGTLLLAGTALLVIGFRKRPKSSRRLSF